VSASPIAPPAESIIMMRTLLLGAGEVTLATAGSQGWWWYPGNGRTRLRAARLVLTGGLAFGGGFGLVGWRVHRRFGSRGLAIFLAAASLYGTIRDWVTSRTIADGVIVFGAGTLPWMADFAAWFTANGLAQAIQIVVRGDPRRERLARAPAEPDNCPGTNATR
jgi:hypothetical protein